MIYRHHTVVGPGSLRVLFEYLYPTVGSHVVRLKDRSGISADPTTDGKQHRGRVPGPSDRRRGGVRLFRR